MNFLILIISLLMSILPLFAAQPSPKAPDDVPCAVRPMTIQYGMLVTCSTTSAATDTYNFDGLAGEQVRISAGPWGTPPVIELWNETGEKVAAGTAGPTEALIVHRLTSTGVYSIRLSVNAARSYSLSLERILPVSPSATQIALGQTIAGEINPMNDVDLYRFAGTGGTRIQLTVAQVSGSQWPAFELYGPDGATLAAEYSTSGTVSSTVQLPVSGSYAVAVWARHAGNNMPYTINVTCPGACFAATINPTSIDAPAAGTPGSVSVTATPATASWVAVSNVAWILITAGFIGTGNGTVDYIVGPNPAPSPRTGTLTIAGQTFTVNQAGGLTAAMGFVPLTPCRVADTRNPALGTFGAPSMAGDTTRSFPVRSSNCGIPGNALAYSMNVTVVPAGPLGFLTMWPAGQTRPNVSTLNSYDGQVTANAAIVPAGLGGSVSVYVSNTTDVILDVNGYFVASNGSAPLYLYPVTPCRVMDTRQGSGFAGAFGGPAFGANTTRELPIPAGDCSIPAGARAYSLNITALPSTVLSYLTAWPAGAERPLASTLNSLSGAVVANAAIVPAGANGAINLFATHATDLIVDVNGYFAPAGAGGQSFYAVTPCRIADTRQPLLGLFGAPQLVAGRTRDFPIASSGCSIPASAQAYSLNATVVPAAALDYLTLWPAGRPLPTVSTLNAFDGRVVANAAIVPAGANGAISAFTSNNTELILDISGYFAP